MGSDPDRRAENQSPSDTEGQNDDIDRSELADRLHDHLRATEQRPVEAGAGRWLGEAQAVAADAARDPPEDALRKRVDQLGHLLENVEGTGDEEADHHVERARELLERIEGRL